MGSRIASSHVFFQLATILLCPVANYGATSQEAVVQEKDSNYKEAKLHAFISISTTEKDITTPITTVPTNPSTTNPLLNPSVSYPDSAGAMNPLTTPATTTSPVSSSASWCVASQSASRIALQVSLDYACGYGGADCSAIQPGGSCYIPDMVRDHASYAFNSYYQKNPIPNSCNFAGTAVTTSTDPSYGTCQYPSTSTSSSILNATNSSGSRVYGGGPITPSASVATMPFRILHFQIFALLFLLERRPINLTFFINL